MKVLKNWPWTISALVGAIVIALTLSITAPATTIDGVAKVVTIGGTGSAFQIKTGEWLTAAHVITDEPEVSLELRNGTAIKATVKWVDKFRDVALLVAPADMKIEVLPLACIVPQVQDVVLHRGYPLGLPYGEYVGRVSTDVFSANERINFWPEMQVTSITAGPGSSGGIIQSRRRAVGMVVGQFKQSPSMIITLTGKYLCDVVEWNNETIRIKERYAP